ncbi:MAG: transcriptional regulator [Nocardioidaceae bacterium]
MTHPINGLDEVVHQRVRLGILAVLAEARRADFAFLRNSLELSDGNLARHLQVLEAAGFVAIEKTFEGKRPRTWVRATPEGGRAFQAEVASLEALLKRVTKQGRGSP